MNLPVPAVEPNGEKVEPVHPTEPGAGRPPAAPAGGARFTYASGAQPLPGYTIKRGVGHGGFGEVYYAMSDGGKEVALKLIRRNLDVELRGIRHCLNLKHPNLLAIFDIRQDGHGDHWVVMEYVTGDSLERAIGAHPRGMPADLAMAWFHGIAAGVACLHDHGVVHRDLKPGNIFSDDGIVKIGDYGLSKFISCSRRSGHTESVGTVHYMAPEIANGRYGKEIDVYALGVILYEMLTGRVPFEGESVGEVLMKHLTTPPDVSTLQEPFRSVVARALEKDPSRRFSSIGEMLAALPRPAQASVQAAPLPLLPGPGGTAPTLPGIPAAPSGPAGRSSQWHTDEPIFCAVRDFIRRTTTRWNESTFNTPSKIALLIVGLVLAVLFVPGLFPAIVVLGVLYGFYWVVRAIVIAVGAPRPGSAAGRPVPPPAQPHGLPRSGSPFVPGAPAQPVNRAYEPRRLRGRTGEDDPVEALVLKPTRQRAAELLGSLVGGALVALTMTVVMVILNSFRGAEPQAAQSAWLGLMGIAGAWVVAIPSKFWEGSRGDTMVRRFTMMVAGLGLGALAFAAASMLHVELPYDPKLSSGPHYHMPTTFYGPERQPMLMAFMAVFGTLFLVIRWWLQSDPLRATRLSLRSLLGSVIFAWLIAELWQFPAPWLMMVAAIISVSVQLASPWLHPRLRQGRQRAG